MRSLLGPYYKFDEGREPQDSVDDIDHSMGIRICKAFCALEIGESRLIYESRYTKPALAQ